METGKLAPYSERSEIVKHRLAILVVSALALTVTQPGWSAARAAGSIQYAQYAGLAWYMSAFELGPWDQYLTNELTPELERLSSRELPRVSWLQFDESILLPEFARPLMSDDGGRPLSLSFRRSRASLTLGESRGGSLRDTSRRFEQSMLMPGLTHRVSDTSDLTVSAVLASQRFGVADMNLEPTDTPAERRESIRTFDPTRSEVSHGTGLRFAMHSELTTGVRLEAAFQSRISMDEFASMRGVHGASAELDIPPRLQLGLQLHATQRASFNIGVSQIFYSDVGAFPSRSLPARFTALLGDRNSPDFAWDDLTVFNLGWHWQGGDEVEMFLDYRTRTQPRPTAPTLAAALESELATNAVIAGLSKGVGERSRLHFNAAYAPPEYAFGGNVLGVVSDRLDQELEVQAMLSFDF